MSAGAESIRNVNRAEPTWPPWLGYGLLYLLPFWACMMALTLAFPLASLFWYPWFWTAYTLALAFLVWGQSIDRIELGSERIVVRRHFYRRAAPLADVLRVEVHRSEWIPRLRGPRHASTLYIGLAG